MDDYLILAADFDGYGTDLYGCNRCGVAVFDRMKHDELVHPEEDNPDPTPHVLEVTPHGS